MNEIFSSRVLEAKLDRSKKFKVEMDKEEKNGFVGRVCGVGLFSGCRVIRAANKAEKGFSTPHTLCDTQSLTSEIWFRSV